MSKMTVEKWEEKFEALLTEAVNNRLPPHDILFAIKYKSLEIEHGLFCAVFDNDSLKEIQ